MILRYIKKLRESESFLPIRSLIFVVNGPSVLDGLFCFLLVKPEPNQTSGCFIRLMLDRYNVLFVENVMSI